MDVKGQTCDAAYVYIVWCQYDQRGTTRDSLYFLRISQRGEGDNPPFAPDPASPPIGVVPKTRVVAFTEEREGGDDRQVTVGGRGPGVRV